LGATAHFGSNFVQINRWSSDPNGTTIHARFDGTHGHIQEQVGHKVPQSARRIHTRGRSVAVEVSTGKVMIIVNHLTAKDGQGGSGRYLEEYLKSALEDPNPDLFLLAVANVAKPRGKAKVATDSGLGRESLYKALTPGAKPRYETFRELMDSLGMRLTVTAA
jgi:probable addiction module antidote protein